MNPFRTVVLVLPFSTMLAFAVIDGVPTASAASPLLASGHMTYPTGSFPFCVAVGDLNGDGKPDLAVANERRLHGVDPARRGRRNVCAESRLCDLGGSPTSLVMRDFDGDGRLDLALACWTAAAVSVLRSNGDGTFAARQDYAVGNTPISLAAGDFNRDGHVDLVTANFNSHDLTVLRGSGDGTFGFRSDISGRPDQLGGGRRSRR